MPPQWSFGVVFTAFTCAAVGGILLASGVMGASWIPRELATIEGRPLAMGSGFALVLLGTVLVLGARRPPPAPTAPISATDAFHSRVRRVPADLVEATPAPSTFQVASPLGEDAGIEEQIRELTRGINRAGVMLAMGQISDRGYAIFVEDLKRQRAELEARRVRLHMGRS